MLNVKDAVKKAKSYVADLFGEQDLRNLALEEIEHDDHDGAWRVTIGFFRPWNATRNVYADIVGQTTQERTYRVVKVRDSDGEVISVTIRDVQH